jgi:hypothetical protein
MSVGVNWGPETGGAGKKVLSFGVPEKGSGNELGMGLEAGVKAWASVLPSSARRSGCMVGRLRRRAGAALLMGHSGAGGMTGNGGVSSETGIGF